MLGFGDVRMRLQGSPHVLGHQVSYELACSQPCDQGRAPVLGAEVDVGGSNGWAALAGRLDRGGRNECGELWGRARGGQQGRVSRGDPLKVGSAHGDREGREAVHCGHAADQRLLWDVAVCKVACSKWRSHLSALSLSLTPGAILSLSARLVWLGIQQWLKVTSKVHSAHSWSGDTM